MIRTPPCRLAGLAVVTALLATACAAARPAHRFIRGTGSGPVELMETPPAAPAGVPDAAIEAAVRKATLERKRSSAPALPTIEGVDAELGEALRNLRERSTGTAHLRVARSYARLGVRDRAIEHFDMAIQKDPRMAAAYDGRARIWRDWHLPGLALGDAHRAVHFAPASPVTRNTLGTVFMALGQCGAAQAAFEEALALDPAASYAADNLEWLAGARAAAECRGARGAPTPGARPAAVDSPVHDPGAE